MALTKEQIEQQKKEAEELLFSDKQKIGFANGLFFGKFHSKTLFPYPQLPAAEQEIVRKAVSDLQQFLDEKVDAAEIDRKAEIPQSVIDGLAELGVLGMTAPVEQGGKGFSQQGYCRILEAIGAHCASTAVFVNAHHSIGVRSLIIYGTEEQKKKWLPDLVSGKKLAAFALTEPEAGSDAANVQTRATPTSDGKGYKLNGEKWYITNGAIAEVLTVMARTPVEGSDETKVTAFIVTPDMDGFEIVQERMEKCGIRGTATGWMRFNDVYVPKENIVGKIGRGLPLALNVLNFGRTTFGASCTGAAHACVKAMATHAKQRVQFKQPLAEFELVKQKIAYAAACAFAMEATTMQCAAFIDRGADDYKLETAMLKVWSTDVLWTIVNDTIQVFGGRGYFSDRPYERWMRDARINQIGEGANDVLRAFITVVGLKPVGDHLLSVKQAWDSRSFGAVLGFVGQQVQTRLTTPAISVRSSRLKKPARALAKRVKDFGQAVLNTLFKFRKDPDSFYFRQYVQGRIADVACELYASSCTLSRLDHLFTQGNGHPEEIRRDAQAGLYFLKISDRRIQERLASLKDNDDEATTATANAILERYSK